MSFEAAAWAIKQTTKTPTEKLVLIALADCVNASTGKCYPTIPYLAQVAITSERQTKRCIQSLEEQNLIKIHREKGRNNHYKLLTTSDTSVTTSRDTHVTSDNMTPVTSMSPPSDIHDTSSSDICDKSSDTHVPLTRNNQEYNQEETRVVVEQQSQQQSFEKFYMHDDWALPEGFESRCPQYGITIDPYDPEILIEFMDHWKTQDVKRNQGEWENSYLKNLKRVKEQGVVNEIRKANQIKKAGGESAILTNDTNW